ncbi:MAG: CHASE2 domain-containing protein, partial [bacterium]
KELAEATERAGNVCHSIFTGHSATSQRLYKKPSLNIAKNLSKFSYFKNRDLSFFIASAETPIEPIFEKTKSIGYVNLYPDSDGVVRRIQPISICYEDPYGKNKIYPLYPSFGLQVACDYLGIKKENVKIVPGKFIDLGKIRIPLDEDQWMLINYRISSFHHIPFSMVLKREIPADYFKGRIVLIGGTAAGLFDFVATPINPSMPGVDVHANIIYSIIKNEFITPIKENTIFFVCFILGVIIGLCLLYLSLLKGLIITSILIIAYLITGLFLFELKGIYLEMVRPLLTMIGVQLFIFSAKALILSIKK